MDVVYRSGGQVGGRVQTSIYMSWKMINFSRLVGFANGSNVEEQIFCIRLAVITSQSSQAQELSENDGSIGQLSCIRTNHEDRQLRVCLGRCVSGKQCTLYAKQIKIRFPH